MKRAFWGVLGGALIAAGVVTAQVMPDNPFGGGSGVAASLACLLTGGADCTMTGAMVSNTAAGTNASYTETGVDRSSASAETWTATNSGAGALTLTTDALSIAAGAFAVSSAGALTTTQTIKSSAVAVDFTTGTNEDLALTPNGTGKVVVPTLKTTVTEFSLYSARVAATFTAGASVLGGWVYPQPVTVTRMVALASTSVGTGSAVFTVSDGTNTCTCTFACPLSNTTPTSFACVNGAGTGCVYAANAAIKTSYTTGCTTTQPTFTGVAVYGLFQ